LEVKDETKTWTSEECKMKFRSDRIKGLLGNQGDVVGKVIREIRLEEKTVLAMGFGVTDQGVPLRFLSYIVPVLHLLRQMGTNTIAEFYFALEGVLRVNGLAEKTTRNNSAIMAGLIRSYVSTFYPDLVGRIVILFDRRVEAGSTLERRIAKIAKIIQQLTTSDESLARFAKTRGGDTAFGYMAEHLLYMRDPLAALLPPEEHLLVPGMISDMDHVIMIGGPAEKIFYRVRLAVSTGLDQHESWKSHQLFTQVGSPPTYHPQPNEPLWGEIHDLPQDVYKLLKIIIDRIEWDEYGTQKAAIRDLIVLLIDCAGVDYFSNAKKWSNLVCKGRSLPDDVQEILQTGWDRLHEL
jgi:hypothetical protein